ncbi:MAG: hypothetical protein OXF28_03280 [Thaumarchaeota archaeon]|nr:hypothetical protein [Nitrososphaerota archaeon]MCY3976138.1 hypothetical protein [Nitrososphaerota archaeon]
MERLNINVSATDYKKTSDELRSELSLLEKSVHGKNDFVITDYEFAFGWYFYVISINLELIKKLSQQLGKEHDDLKGKNLEKKFLTLLTDKMKKKKLKIKLAIKEEMESTKFGIF